MEEPTFELEVTVDGGNDTLPTDDQDMQDLEDDTNADLSEIERALDGGVSADATPADEVEPTIAEEPTVADEATVAEIPVVDSGFDSGEDLEAEFATENAEGAERL